MRVFLFINLIGLALLNTTVQAFDLENGKALHNESCLRCHDKSLYTQKDSKITDYKKLRARVSQCELMAELGWFDEEIDDVAHYLNQNFYRFELEK